MKRLLALMLVLLSVTLLVSIASANDGNKGRKSYFIGLWEGVDPNDGSRRTISISDNDGDGVFDLTQYDTFWTLCGSDRGISKGTGTIGPDGILSWAGTLECLETGAVVAFEVDYEPVRLSGILVEQITVGPPLEPALLHRVSTNQPQNIGGGE